MPADSNSLQEYSLLANHKSLLTEEKKTIVSDVQQMRTSRKNGFVFILLMFLLATITYVKTVFGKELEEMLQSIVNQNLAQQIFRTQSGEISFASFLFGFEKW